MAATVQVKILLVFLVNAKENFAATMAAASTSVGFVMAIMTVVTAQMKIAL